MVETQCTPSPTMSSLPATGVELTNVVGRGFGSGARKCGRDGPCAPGSRGASGRARSPCPSVRKTVGGKARHGGAQRSSSGDGWVARLRLWSSQARPATTHVRSDRAAPGAELAGPIPARGLSARRGVERHGAAVRGEGGVAWLWRQARPAATTAQPDRATPCGGHSCGERAMEVKVAAGEGV
jgi:hypothetical protein